MGHLKGKVVINQWRKEKGKTLQGNGFKIEMAGKKVFPLYQALQILPGKDLPNPLGPRADCIFSDRGFSAIGLN